MTDFTARLTQNPLFFGGWVWVWAVYYPWPRNHAVLRIPAFYNGVFGHKPTGGTVPNTRTMPQIQPDSTVSTYCQLGPTARSAHDLMPLLRVLAGPDGVDLVARENTDYLQHAPESVPPGALTIYNFAEAFAPTLLRCGLHPELRAAQPRRYGCWQKLMGARLWR